MKNQDFFNALGDLEQLNGVSGEEYIATLETAITSAYKKICEGAGKIKVELNPEKKEIKVYNCRNVVEEITDPETEILLEDAKKIKKTIKVGDVLKEEINTKDFGRIPAGNIRQMTTQKLREIERQNTVSEFEDKEGELMACTVRRIEKGKDGDIVYVELSGQMEGIMVPKDQVPTEKYEVNQRLNVFVKRVKTFGKNSQVIVSRSSTGLVKRLFENEVPEIKQGLVIIKNIAREAGQRTKIAIYSEDPNVDAIGACVGNKGARVNAIVEELGGEKIDIIPWSENPLEFIANAISPAKAIKVMELDGENNARVIVPDDKLSLAIGRKGQNARLAVRLTNWKIDVKSESDALSEGDFADSDAE